MFDSLPLHESYLKFSPSHPLLQSCSSYSPPLVPFLYHLEPTMNQQRTETNPHFIRPLSRHTDSGPWPTPHHHDPHEQPPSGPWSPPHRHDPHGQPPSGPRVKPQRRESRKTRPRGPVVFQPTSQGHRPLLDQSPPRGEHPVSSMTQPQHEGQHPLPRDSQAAQQQPHGEHRPARSPEVPPPQPHLRGPRTHGPIIPPPKKTNPITWSAAFCCAIFWIIIILGGLVVLIVYLVFRPHSPRFDVASVSLNAAYLDMGYLLNADLTVLANFTNPNKKVKVDFSYMTIDLYYGHILIATQYVEPFSAARALYELRNVHLVSSQVRLPLRESERLQKQIDSNAVSFEIKGTFRSRSIFGSFLRYSYWLYAHCSIVVTGPPTGVLRVSRCRTKR